MQSLLLNPQNTNHIICIVHPGSSSLCCNLLDLQYIAIRLPDSLPVFELLVLMTDEFPQLCVGVRDDRDGDQTNSQQVKFDVIELNNMPLFSPGRPDLFVFHHCLFRQLRINLQLKFLVSMYLQIVED